MRHHLFCRAYPKRISASASEIGVSRPAAMLPVGFSIDKPQLFGLLYDHGPPTMLGMREINFKFGAVMS